MIIDFNVDDKDTYEADICIIGTGIAAYAIISELKEFDLNIILLERGTSNSDNAERMAYECDITGHPFHGSIDGRNFTIGGTSVSWGGQAMPMSAFDLEKKPWNTATGWIIPFEELTSYYATAERLLNLNDIAYSANIDVMRGLVSLEFNAETLQYQFSKWSPSPNLKNKLISICKSNSKITVLENANCCEIVKKNTSISELHIRSSQGKQGVIKAEQYILAAGGIENPRLLLMSPTVNRQHTKIGLMFQDHPTAQVATIFSKNDLRLQNYFNYFFVGKTRFLPRLSLSKMMQQKEKLEAATAFIQFIPPPYGLFHSIRGAYRSVIRKKMPSRVDLKGILVNILDLSSLGKIGYFFFGKKQIYTPHAVARVTIMLEQTPSDESFIRLSERLDIYSNPLPEVHWIIPEGTIRTCRKFCEILHTELETNKLGRIEWEQWTKGNNDIIQSNLSDAYHHMGSTRMSFSIEDGVVDADCKMHGIDNLYIAGSSVFPTSGHSNPTLTMMALSIRLARRIQGKIISSRQLSHV